MPGQTAIRNGMEPIAYRQALDGHGFIWKGSDLKCFIESSC